MGLRFPSFLALFCSFPNGSLELPASDGAVKDVILIAVRCVLETEGQTELGILIYYGIL